ncbi:MAG: hypothetical protein RIQ52_417 [Pseudomonadota bacterium]
MLDDTTRARLNMLVDGELATDDALSVALSAESDPEARRFLDRQRLVGELMRSSGARIAVQRDGSSLADRVSLAVASEVVPVSAEQTLGKAPRSFENVISLALAASLVAVAVYVGHAMQSDSAVNATQLASLAADTGATTQASLEAGLEPYILMHTQSAEHHSASMLPYMRVATHH